MLNWFKKKQTPIEKRSYTDALVNALQAAVVGEALAPITEHAIIETAAIWWADAMRAVTIEPAAEGLVVKQLLPLAIREMLRRGEFVAVIEVENGNARLYPVSQHVVKGTSGAWRYQVDVAAPDGTKTRTVPAESVVHLMWAVSPERPWEGIAPHVAARRTSVLAAGLEQRVGEEAGAPTGRIVPIPMDPDTPDDDGGGDKLEGMRKQLADSKGRTLLVPSVNSAGWELSDAGRGRVGAAGDWQARRHGMDLPSTSVELRRDAARDLLAATGVPEALVGTADGTSKREALRQFTLCHVQPRLDEMLRSFSFVMETRLTGTVDALYGHDLAGRAAALKALADAGMDLPEARRVAGL